MDAVGLIPPPVGRHTTVDFDGWGGITVRGMMVVDAGIEFYMSPLGETTKSQEVDIKTTDSQRQYIDQPITYPSFDVQAVEVTPGQIFRETCAN